MMKKLLLISIIALSGCSTIKEYWPRPHDPVMFNQLITADIAVEKINCDQPTWGTVVPVAEHLARYAEWRQDPQRENLKGLQAHVERMNKGGSKTFCEIGKKTARQRIAAARSAWEGR